MPEKANAEIIFGNAIEIASPEERKAFLDQACQDDPGLRQSVERLVLDYFRAGSFLNQPAAQIAAPTQDLPITEKPGTQIGPYKLLQQIGEGGMGVVYMAEQKRPMKRRVALKIIKPGMDTRQVIARFEAERQALAMMDHPNISKVLDAGQTESGRPYFVMELVNGISVTKYCDQQHLTTKERLDLFVSICQAVQHAHQKGIIHRDLKPSNILVALYDGQPSTKVIDFGVAKATNQSLTDKTMFTQLGQIVGTLEYMSPEQAERNQLDIDTRSDIYSLGVVLYELLTGETPFDQQRLRSAAFEEMLRIIREEEPPKPSTKLSSSESLPSIAVNRQIEPKKLSVLVRGELDWIVMKAMEKDRGRRYETASKFAEDVQNYLNDEAVAACPPSRRYKFQKFARRNKAAIATAVAIVGTLIVGIIGTTWQAIEADSERDRAVIAEGLAENRLATVSQQKDEIFEEKKRAEEQAAITQAVSDFLQKDLLGMADAAKQVENEVTPDPNIKLLTLLDRAAATIEDRFNDQPLVKAAIRETLGKTYFAIGRYQEAEEQFRQSLEIRRRVSGREHLDTLGAMHNLAKSYYNAGRLDEAFTMEEEVLTLRRKVLGPEHPDTLSAMANLAVSYHAAGRLDEALTMEEEVLPLSRKVLGPEHPQTFNAMNNLANSYYNAGRLDESLTMREEVLPLRRKVLGPEHPDTLSAMANLAVSYYKAGRRDEALTMREEVLPLSRKVLGPEHPQTLLAMNNLANSYYNAGRLDEALTMREEVLTLRRKVLGPEHPDTLGAMHNLANSYATAGRRDEALTMREEILPLSRKVLGPEHPQTLDAMNNLAVSYYKAGRLDESLTMGEEVLTLSHKLLGPEHPDTLSAMNNLASSYYKAGRLDEALTMEEEVLTLSRKLLGPEHPQTLIAMANLAVSYYKAGRLDEALTMGEGVLTLSRKVLGPEHPQTFNAMMNLASSYYKAGRLDEALTMREEVLTLRRKLLGPEHPDTLSEMANLAVSYYKAGRLDEALTMGEGVLTLSRKVLGPEHPQTFNAMMNLASSYYKAGRLDEALTMREEVLTLRRKLLGPEHPQTLIAMANLAVSYYKAGRLDEALTMGEEVLTLSRKVLGPEHPQTFNAMINLASSYVSAGREDEVSKMYEELVHYQPKNPAIPGFLNTLAWPLVSVPDQEGNYPRAGEAVQWARQACELAPNNGALLNTLGTALYRTLQWQEAIDALLGSTKNGFDVPHNWLFIAMSHWHLDDKAKAKEWYDKSLAWQTANAKAAKADAELQRFYAEAAQLMAADKNDSVNTEDGEAAPKPKPSDSDPDQAASSDDPADDKQAIAMDGDVGWFQLGLTCRERQEWTTAAEAFERQLHFHPAVVSCRSHYAVALVASGQLAKYREFCAELLERDGQTEDPKIARSLTQPLLCGADAVDEWSLPLELSQLLLDNGGGNHQVTSHVSELLCRAGKYERSLELRAKAIAQACREPDGWDCFWRAMAHHGLGNIGQARELARQARELADSGQLLVRGSSRTKFEFMHRELIEKLDASPLPPGEVGLSGPGDGNSIEKGETE